MTEKDNFCMVETCYSFLEIFRKDKEFKQVGNKFNFAKLINSNKHKCMFLWSLTSH